MAQQIIMTKATSTTTTAATAATPTTNLSINLQF